METSEGNSKRGGDSSRRTTRSRSRSPRRSRSRSDSYDRRRRRSSSRDRNGRDRHSSKSRQRDDDRRDYNRDRDGGYSRSRSRYYDNRERDRDDRRSGSRRRSSSRSPERSKPGSVMELLNKVMGGGGGLVGQVASAMMPSGAGLPSYGVPTTMTDVTGTLAKIQALSGNMPNGAEKSMRELYVGGLPQGVPLNANQIRDFFNLVMTQSGLVRAPGQPVVQARIHESGGFAFVQFRSQEETDLALSLNGIPFLNSPLKIGRPKGYHAAVTATSAATSNVAAGVSAEQLAAVAGSLGLAPSAAANEVSADVILVANVPSALSVEAIREIMVPFGAIADCVVIPSAAGAATIRALVRYDDPSINDTVIAGLNNLPIGDINMSLSRAPMGLVAQHLPHRAVVSAPSQAPLPLAQDVAPVPVKSEIIELLNVVVPADIGTEEELLEIREDVAEECGKYGRVVEVVIPSLDWWTANSQGAGPSVPVFVHLASIADAEKCADAMRLKKFEGRFVTATFVDRARFESVKAAQRVDPAPPSGGDLEAEEDAGADGGHGQHFGSVAVPPPSSYASLLPVAVGGAEDGMSLPPVPSAADID